MTAYRDIDDLLLTTNKGGTFAYGGGSEQGATLPRPGDGVVVSFVDKGLRDILVHTVDADLALCRGETRDGVSERDGNRLVEQGESVQFSLQKIAGINRR